jgi:hypothetical protein
MLIFKAKCFEDGRIPVAAIGNDEMGTNFSRSEHSDHCWARAFQSPPPILLVPFKESWRNSRISGMPDWGPPDTCCLQSCRAEDCSVPSQSWILRIPFVYIPCTRRFREAPWYLRTASVYIVESAVMSTSVLCFLFKTGLCCLWIIFEGASYLV